MREILFKAKRVDNGEWIEGAYYFDGKRHYIITDVVDKEHAVYGHRSDDVAMYVVDVLTVSQYTGLTDINGSRIWENDIVCLNREDGYLKVEWDDDTARFAVTGDGITVDFDNYWSDEFTVEGNVFDNPELMKGGAE